MFKRKGFTLTEMMIALAILGILTALVLPMINGNAPSRNRMMMKKAYYTIEDIVRSLINDEGYYSELGSDGSTYVGFDNLENGAQCSGNSCSGLHKFPALFSEQLNVDGDVSYGGAGSTIAYFTTSDGMQWTVSSELMSTPPAEITDIEPGNNQVVQTIVVDVNGNKKPNCIEGEGSCVNRSSKGVDQFKVYVSKSGKVIPAYGQSWFEDAISIDSSVSDGRHVNNGSYGGGSYGGGHSGGSYGGSGSSSGGSYGN